MTFISSLLNKSAKLATLSTCCCYHLYRPQVTFQFAL
ncbi:hypothetical protein EQG49_06810 [Periweissella cryptocerci]|uniref:Uncharacterized protein n=1 Tax=Periweissella cryptocerci TaxID=2506420 RepID=A0A4P6YXH1_9LACO|nr:hypothetical protein EQG49_06810 [Periweissella cryptocerci]